MEKTVTSKNRSAVETGNFSYIREIINRDYSTYAGRILESFYQQVFADIKLDSSRIKLKALKEKASKLSEEYRGYKKEWLGLHIGNIREFLK